MVSKHAFSARVRQYLSEVWPVAVIMLLSWCSIVCSIDPAGSYPGMPEGPGLTVDEIFNVTQGVYLTEQARRLGWLNLIPGTSQEAYRPENGFYNPDHPPLGRWWLGLHHLLTRWIAPPADPKDLFTIACARTGSATAFALTVFLIGASITRWHGRAAGVMSAISLVLMPRVYGHAHLASLETITNLTCTAAVLGVAHWWNGSQPPTRRMSILAGALLGVAMLTKIQVVLILVPILCWTLWRWRKDAVVPLILWCAAALVVFFAGWPYLWFNSFDHLSEYFGRATNRATLSVWYLGQKYPDRLVPWHYPFVMFGLTVPVILHGFGLVAVSQSFSRRFHQTNPLRVLAGIQGGISLRMSNGLNQETSACANLNWHRDVLFLSCVLFPLILFAIPGIAVYDGERLFLTCFPFWAVFVGRGWVTGWHFIGRLARSTVVASTVFSVLVIIVGMPLWTMAPCHLCYYNEIVSRLMGGVERAGLEVDYWGEGITRHLLRRLVEEVPEGATVAVIPTLHQFQADDYMRQSPMLRSHRIKIVEFQDAANAQTFLLVFRRRADLPEKWVQIKPAETMGATVLDGNFLAYFIRTDEILPGLKPQ